MLAAGYEPVRRLETHWRFRCRSVRRCYKPHSLLPYELGHATEENRAEIERLVALAIEIGRKHEPKDVS